MKVPDATLAKARGKKLRDYARVGIADYWIINLVSSQLEVHRDPGLLPDSYSYKSRQVLLDGDTVTPLSASGTPVAVADLFPQITQP